MQFRAKMRCSIPSTPPPLTKPTRRVKSTLWLRRWREYLAFASLTFHCCAQRGTTGTGGSAVFRGLAVASRAM